MITDEDGSSNSGFGVFFLQAGGTRILMNNCLQRSWGIMAETSRVFTVLLHRLLSNLVA